jgi:hypothetical protein
MNDPGLAAQLQSLMAQFQQQNPAASTGKEKHITRRKFTPEEDELIRNLVTQYCASDWNTIAQHFHNRTPRQCRDRWRNYVSPEVLTGRWSEADEETLLAKVREIGPRWATIARFFPGRTDIGVKNHYISITGKRTKDVNNIQVGAVQTASGGAQPIFPHGSAQ